MEQQKALDEDKSLTVATGKITLKEMKLDQLKPMKNKVRGFYYVKKEDIGQKIINYNLIKVLQMVLNQILLKSQKLQKKKKKILKIQRKI